MKKRVFIIHGWEGSPDEAWLFWIRGELKKKGYEVTAPQMPDAEKPRMEEWIPFLSSIVGESDEDTSFIGHSIGCQAILRYIESIYPKKVGHVALVAGWFNLINLEDKESEAIAKPWIESPIDFKKVKNSCSDITVLLSEDDPWVLLSDKKIFEGELGAKVIIEKGKGHYTKDDGILDLPEVSDLFE